MTMPASTKLLAQALHAVSPDLPKEACTDAVNLALALWQRGDPRGMHRLLLELALALDSGVLRDIDRVLRHVSRDEQREYGVGRYFEEEARPIGHFGGFLAGVGGRKMLQHVSAARNGDTAALAQVVGWVLFIMGWHANLRRLSPEETEVLAAAKRIEHWLTPNTNAVH